MAIIISISQSSINETAAPAVSTAMAAAAIGEGAVVTTYYALTIFL